MRGRRSGSVLMPARYLLDRNTASYVIKGNIPRVREHLVKVPMALVSISPVTEAELRFGVARRPDVARLRIAVEEFLLRVDALPWGFRGPRGTTRMCAPPSNAMVRRWVT
jgi:hypothetical protein